MAFVQGETSNGEIHQWAADGTLILVHEIQYFVDDKLISTTITESNYIHNNWGFNGNSNGYCLEGVFDTSKIYTYPFIARSRADYSNNIKYFLASTKIAIGGLN